MAKLNYSVIACSGADPDFAATELNVHSPHTRGWQTSRFCEYPQEVIVELARGASISQIQLLSHQHKIATRIELFVGSGSSLDRAAWTRLGYLSLDTNERSRFQARELKSVYVDAQGRYLKLVAHRCHVGIIAMNVLGEYALEHTDNDILSGNSLANPCDHVDDLAFGINVDPLAARQIRLLLTAKEAAVEAEDYDTAKRLKAAERQLRSLGGQLAQLKNSKRCAVRDEDYDRAKLIKHEIAALRRRISDALELCETVARASHEDKQPPPPSTPRTDNVISSKDSAGAEDRAIPQIFGAATTDQNGDDANGRQSHDTVRTPSSTRTKDDSIHSPAPLSKTPYSNSLHVSPVLDALAGVPNAAELPSPEPFAADMNSNLDLVAVTTLLGDYRARCLVSKNWSLREATLAKVRLLLDEGNWEQFEDLEQLCDITRSCVHDKIAQVYLTALALLDDVAHKFAACGFKRTEAFPALEPALAAVVMKLGDNQPRLRDKAVDALTSLSRCRVVGADRVAERVMRSLDKKRPAHNKWRPVATRLEFLKKLAHEFGVETRDAAKKGSHALVLESVLEFVETHCCASHTFEEVRSATKELVVASFIAVPEGDRLRLLEPFLNKLRPKQATEYQTAINRGLDHAVPNLRTLTNVQEAYEILKVHFSDASQKNPVKESVLTEWVNEVGSDIHNSVDISRDDKLWKSGGVATRLQRGEWSSHTRTMDIVVAWQGDNSRNGSMAIKIYIDSSNKN
ncbi:hypothetical protein AURANDRAFT_72373 [Aureococcus anophagefferens]|uniref:TOG domain-containing protein n=1 Tax=Aureococcus anophagefferens TaxID=44056 RepID=F0YIN9_AURAN|nr:hypothetical protein AURANDRAFT_72373 [Aureococcus anophagefferens]EGB04924.1 hypothetical protein AURANDRAFT_72373 [Aureococcus anophagefferens]|eukprot:XP_009040279.1 hypothetical protein AURANDRAFT_72373 [Aureococcus anophagefferens]